MRLFGRDAVLAVTLILGWPNPQVVADAAPQILRFYGYGHDLKTGRYLYTEVQNLVIEDGRWTRGTTKFYAADGHLLGQRRLEFGENEQLPVFQLDLVKARYSEGITAVNAHSLTMTRTDGGKTETASVALLPDMAADAGFDRLIVRHFDALKAGETLRFTLVVPGRLAQFRFRVSKTGDTQFEGRPAIALTVELDSLLRVVAPPLKLIYGAADHRLLEFAGLSNIRDPVSGDNYVVRIDYNAQPPTDAPGKLPPLDN